MKALDSFVGANEEKDMKLLKNVKFAVGRGNAALHRSDCLRLLYLSGKCKPCK